MTPPHPASGGLPSPDAVRRLVTRGRPAEFPLPPTVPWSGVPAAAEGLRAGLGADDLLVIASPGAGPGRPPSLVVRRLVDRDEARRLRGPLEALVAEFRDLAHRLAVPFRLHVEPALVGGDEYPDELEAAGETWSLHVHGEHCLFAGLVSGREVEVNTDDPDAVDPGFLLRYAESTGRHAEVRAACVEGFHDMDRMLTLAGLGPRRG
ncbi:hypothetical protein [Saccharothrix syringae]|uniref:Uncharacterized protein n=1 Tax=Saccharothrix syringae TaxID=103733 RepID=A0A5Q0GUP6_SACSY|nr:hypothetical protein [Saccharothrix syringae]QFZ17224.1 hypothetical protein EKG83_06875 [Saccharothrix syringae]